MIGFIKTLNRAYKINNTTQGFQNYVNTLTNILKWNMFPSWSIKKSIKVHLRKDTKKEASKYDASSCHFHKLSYIGFCSSYTRKKISSITSQYCDDLMLE